MSTLIIYIMSIRKVIQRDTRCVSQILGDLGAGKQILFDRCLNLNFIPDEFIVRSVQYRLANALDVGTYILNTDLVLKQGFNQIATFTTSTTISNEFKVHQECTKTNLNRCIFWMTKLVSNGANTAEAIVSLSNPIANTDPAGQLFVIIEFVKYEEA